MRWWLLGPNAAEDVDVAFEVHREWFVGFGNPGGQNGMVTTELIDDADSVFEC